MRYVLLTRCTTALQKLPPNISAKFWKQIGFLLRDISHPSLRAKKYDETNNVWQARVNRKYRFYFRIEGTTYLLLDIIAHPE